MLERSSNTPFRERSGPAKREGRGKDAVTDIDLQKPPTSRLPCLRVPRPWRGHPLICPITPFFLGLVPARPPFVVAKLHPWPTYLAPGSYAACGRGLLVLWVASVTAGGVVRAWAVEEGGEGPRRLVGCFLAHELSWWVAAAGGPLLIRSLGWSTRAAETGGAPRARG